MIIFALYNYVLLHFAAVKFGRMSKKQREKVEDEVRFHRAQMRAASETAPDSSVFEHQTPSSSDQHHSYNSGSVFFFVKIYLFDCKKELINLLIV